MAILVEKPSIEFIRNAVIAPLTQIELSKGGKLGRFDGGVYRSDQSVCETAIIRKGAYLNELASYPENIDSRALEGSHVFGGMLQNTHFGHFMAESLSRIWAKTQLSDDFTCILYFARIQGRPIPKWANELFGLLFSNTSVMLVDHPSRVEHLAVPSQLSDPIGTVHGHPLVREVLSPLSTLGEQAGRRLYVSRSGLNANEGGFLLEGEIEARLEGEGYEIIRPETMSIRAQFEAYNSADHLVFAEGSALHLYALAARPDQKVFIIWRRKSGPTFINQIRSFGGQTPFGQPAIRKLWEPALEFGARAKAQAMLDYESLGAQLAAAGFISASSKWSGPDPAREYKALDAAAFALRKAFREVNV